MINSRRLRLPWHASVLPLAFTLVGAAVALAGLGQAAERTWLNLLVDAFYVMSLGVSAAFFAATQRLAGARWSAGLRRIPEAFMLTLPAAAALMVVLFFGRHQLYPWTDPALFADEPAFAGKAWYLKPSFVFARMGGALLLWIVFAFRFRKSSLAQDRHPERNLVYHQRLDRHAAVFVPLFGLTFTLAANDWIVSLEPKWFSTIFAVYVFAGTFVQGIAAVTLAAVVLRGRDLLAVDDEQLHDLGKMLFAFSTFWAYIWVCQYLLIWYGNIPEEVTYYVARTNSLWLPLFLANVAVNWIAPFCALLSARAKRTPGVLAAVSVLLLVGHWLDLYLLVMPSKRSAPQLGSPEVLIALGSVALAFLVSVRCLARARLVPINDPVLLARGETS